MSSNYQGTTTFHPRICPILQIGRSKVRISMRSQNFFNVPNPSNCTMALELTHALMGTSTWGVESSKRIRLTSLPFVSCLENVDSSTSPNSV
jgi:hypothetical protein